MLLASQIKYNKCIDLLQPLPDNPHAKSLHPQISTQRRKDAKTQRPMGKIEEGPLDDTREKRIKNEELIE